jgi:hypothetical protein
MSKISLEGNVSGSGTLTIAAPNTNSNFTLTLPTETGTIITNSGNQAGSFTTLNTSGQVVFNDAGADVDFRVEGDTDPNLLFVDASTDRVGIGTNTPDALLNVDGIASFGAGSASTPSIAAAGDLNTGIFFPAADTIAFAEGGAEAMRITSDGDLLLNATSKLTSIRREISVRGADGSALVLGTITTPDGFQIVCDSANAALLNNKANTPTIFYTNNTEVMRITSDGYLLVGKTVVALATAGARIFSNGQATFTVSEDGGVQVNRLTNDGALVFFYQDSTLEGNISVSGSTVSYNGGHLSRWAQMLTKPDLLKGTVMSNLDEMNVYVKPTLYWTEEDELPVDEEGNPTVAVGDVKEETSVSDNEQLNKVKVSDVEGDPNVAGVFVNWEYDEAHEVDEINMAMTGDMIIRIAGGVTVARGDLLMSAGDGTAKPQGDDIVRSKTIAKVTSTHVTCTYENGSYCVPCVLMAC